MKYLLLLTLAVLTLGQERCRAPLVSEGVCSPIADCPFLHTISVNGNIPDFIRDHGGCGFRNGNLRLCCPLDSTIRPTLSVTSSTPLVITPVFTTSTSPPVDTSSMKPSTASSIIAECPTAYTLIADQCLYIGAFGTGHTSWSKAETECTKNGGSLAVLNNVDRVAQYFSDRSLGGKSAWYWVGANDHEIPGTFKWTSGDLVQETWISTKPWTTRPGQMCVYFTDEGFGTTPCSDQTWFICEST